MSLVKSRETAASGGPLLRPPRLSLLLALLLFTLPARARDPVMKKTAPPSVGVSRELQGLVIPGGEVEARPAPESSIPVVVRIMAVYPHGAAFRYDLVYYGLEAGDFDLRGALRRKDGKSLDDAPPIPVTIARALPEGRVKPAELEAGAVPVPVSYQRLLLIGAIIWAVGLAAMLALGRKKIAAELAAAPPPSLEEQLRPLIEAGIAGSISSEDQARLERILLAHWREKLGLQRAKPAAAMAALRAHPEAGGLLRQLEDWLHRPGPKEAGQAAEILRPYRGPGGTA